MNAYARNPVIIIDSFSSCFFFLFSRQILWQSVCTWNQIHAFIYTDESHSTGFHQLPVHIFSHRIIYHNNLSADICKADIITVLCIRKWCFQPVLCCFSASSISGYCVFFCVWLCYFQLCFFYLKGIKREFFQMTLYAKTVQSFLNPFCCFFFSCSSCLSDIVKICQKFQLTLSTDLICIHNRKNPFPFLELL